jgi:hypothetical protein
MATIWSNTELILMVGVGVPVIMTELDDIHLMIL